MGKSEHTFGKRRRPAHRAPETVPVLCRFWREDGVWNATAQDLPVAVFGESFDESYRNLVNALISHFQSIDDAGKIEEIIAFLQKKAQIRFRVNEIVADTPYVKMLVPLDQEAELNCV